MAVALPIISAFSAVSAAGGVGAALTAGFASFAAVAGGFITGAGLLSGNKKLQKFGSLVSLAGGIYSMASNLGGAGATAGDEASSAWDSADASAGKDAAQFGKHAREVAEAATNTGGAAAQSVAEATGGIGPFVDPTGAAEIGLSMPGGSLVDQARALGYATPPAATPSWAAAPSASKAIVEGAGQIKSGDHLNSLLEQIGRGAKGVGQFVKDNKELVQLGGSMLQSMYDPRYEALDYEKGLRAQRLRNLNNPIVLGNNPIVLNRAGGG